MVNTTNVREDAKTQIAGQPAIDKNVVSVHKNGFDVLKNKDSLTDEEKSQLDDEIVKDLDLMSLTKEASKTETLPETKKLDTVSLSVKKLFEKLGNPESVKYNFDFSAIRDTPFGKSVILTNKAKKLSLFIGIDSVLGSILVKKGYEKSLNIGSSGFMTFGRIESSKEKGHSYFVLDDIMLKTKMLKGNSTYEI